MSGSGKRNLQGMNLRKWLKKHEHELNKAERLQMYKQVVQVVDMAHSQGNALLDLRLSTFVIFPSDHQIIYSGSICSTQHLSTFSSVAVELEKKWYACPEERCRSNLLSANIYSLGILLFEILTSFVSMESRSAEILNLHNRILPPTFISHNPQEAGLCLWLLHPDPSSRPTTREILQSEVLSDLCPQTDYPMITDKSKDEILLDFLVSLKAQKEKDALEIRQHIQLLETDMKSFQHKKASYDSNMLHANISQLEGAYFSKRSPLQAGEAVINVRNDLDLLCNRESCYVGVKKHSVQEKYVGCSDEFLNDVCKFIRYSRFEVSGMLQFSNLLNFDNIISSLSFERDENYLAVADGISKKIKIFEFDSLLHDSVEVTYPAVELLNTSKLSCVCWNKYLNNYLVSADYDGVVQVWDAFTGQGLSRHVEHQRRAWCVDFSHVDPTIFASGSDDQSVKLWSLSNKTSTCTIRTGASVCCVQFSSQSSHLLAFGSSDSKIHCYDLRHTRIPWCTLAGHHKAVSYVKFLGSDSLVSASTDSTLKLWDLKKTTLEGVSSDACCMTYTGHSNEKNFVGLSVLDGYIACGSETNEVYTYHKSFPMPITSYKFGCTDERMQSLFQVFAGGRNRI